MGGNTHHSVSTRVRTSPTHRFKTRPQRVAKLLAEMRELTPAERRKAMGALRRAGHPELARALEALVPEKRFEALVPVKKAGSRPPERG